MSELASPVAHKAGKTVGNSTRLSSLFLGTSTEPYENFGNQNDCPNPHPTQKRALKTADFKNKRETKQTREYGGPTAGTVYDVLSAQTRHRSPPAATLDITSLF